MDKIIAFFRQWDKLAHASVSLTIMVWTTGLISLILPLWMSIILGSVITLATGVVEEIKDSKQDGNIFSWQDIIADCTGWLLGVIPLILIAL